MSEIIKVHKGDEGSYFVKYQKDDLWKVQHLVEENLYVVLFQVSKFFTG
jgi:hypothetical protein